MDSELEQQIIKQIELQISSLKQELDKYASKVLSNSSNKSTKPMNTVVNDIAKLVDVLDVIAEER